jgi:hypothetical protein
MIFYLLPFLVQGLLMTVDEFYCHKRRQLRRWERVGHPIDTITFIVCLLFLIFMPATRINLWIYGVLSLISCLMISKDEWEHKELCTGLENWLHSLLFMIHPVVLIWIGFLWWTETPEFAVVADFCVMLSLGFLFYQSFYWNWRRRDQQ